ncbi:MAG: extracellular solute-binding protein [Anaerolineae bacterium]|nr:extracellular solute-binding protein [Anaerolineae bacterium]
MSGGRSRRWKSAWRWRCSLVLAVVLLTACALPPAPATDSPLPTPSPTFSPTATPTPPSPGRLVSTLTLWLPEELTPYAENPGAKVLAQQLSDFNLAYDDLQVQAIVKKAQGRGGLLDFLRTASVTAPTVLPDLIVLRSDDMQVAAQAGLLQPLDGLLSENLSTDRYPFAIALGQVDGQTMAIPLTAELEHLAYQPVLFDRPPITWTDVLSSETSFLFPAAGREGALNDATLVQYLGAGGRLADGEGNPQLDPEPLAAVLGFYSEIAAAGVISPPVLLTLEDSTACWERFLAGEAGMVVVNSRQFWTAQDVAAAPGVLPSQTGQAVAIARGEWVLALVATDPQRQQQAMFLLEWLLSPERYGTWTQNTGYLPTTRGGLAAWEILPAERAVLDALLERSQLPPAPEIWQVVGAPLQVAVNAVLMGRRSPAAAAAEAVRAVQP